MASLWKLPAIFVCENNKYGMGTSVNRAAASTAFYTRGDYVPGLWVDGMDVLAVKAGFDFATNWCRTGKGPIFLEMETYRYHGHSMSDPGVSYRKKEEIDQVRATMDCIDLVKKRLIKQGWATEADIKAAEKDARAEIDKASETAQQSALPADSELFTDIEIPAPVFIRAVEYPTSAAPATTKPGLQFQRA